MILTHPVSVSWQALIFVCPGSYRCIVISSHHVSISWEAIIFVWHGFYRRIVITSHHFSGIMAVIWNLLVTRFLSSYRELVTSSIQIMALIWYFLVRGFSPPYHDLVKSHIQDYGSHLKSFSQAVLTAALWSRHMAYPYYGDHLIPFNHAVLTAVSWSCQITYPGLWW